MCSKISHVYVYNRKQSYDWDKLHGNTSSIVHREVTSRGIICPGMRGGGGAGSVTTWLYTLFKPTLASGNSCEVSDDSPAAGWPLTRSLLPPFPAPQRSSGVAAGQGDPAAAGARQHLWWQYHRQGGVWHGVPPRRSDLRSRNGCRGRQDPWEQRHGPPGYHRGRGRHAVQAAPTVRDAGAQQRVNSFLNTTVHIEFHQAAEVFILLFQSSQESSSVKGVILDS